MSSTEVLKQLAEIRKSQELKSQQVIHIAEPLAAVRGFGTSEEAWLAYEQVCVAACDLGRLDLARICLETLQKRFPGSLRVRRLHGLLYEANREFDRAEKEYRSILEAEPNNIPTTKRLIAVLKAKGEISECVKQLNDYVDTYYNDPEAWLELCHLYLRLQMYPQAAFCMEELILQQPHNHFFHLKYAEIQYTIGDIEAALTEYLRVVELATDHLRGFYGIKLCVDRLLESPDSNASGKKKSPASSGRRGDRSAAHPSVSTDDSTSSAVGKSKPDTGFDRKTLEELAQLAATRLLNIYFRPSSADPANSAKATNTATPMSKAILESWLKG
ncbi:tetratricopeptide repeat domain-containing protein [Spiromyces aspiralis]|uniref:Tetratricopeptide repeat domain-containing protein n=1 Tax=Spiromyces aspiralis TaxID=68401 RepID=A0ACC1HFU9_9FUNG|nr:tetratricopeptide repeat domain-containing protein [Spiromyces aspiralis]